MLIISIIRVILTFLKSQCFFNYFFILNYIDHFLLSHSKGMTRMKLFKDNLHWYFLNLKQTHFAYFQIKTRL